MKRQKKPRVVREINAKPVEIRETEDMEDVYLQRVKETLLNYNVNPRALWRFFQRHEGARFFGREEFLKAYASLLVDAYGYDTALEFVEDTIIYSVPEGCPLRKHETAMTIEGPGQALILNESLLAYLNHGTRFRTLSAQYPAKKYPWVFMGRRYVIGKEYASVITRALCEENIPSTVPALADFCVGTENHGGIGLWGFGFISKKVEKIIAEEVAGFDEDAAMKVAATIRQTVAYAATYPEKPLYALVDFAARSVGVAKTLIAVARVSDRLELDLKGGRLDNSKTDLSEEAFIDATLMKDYSKEIQDLSEALNCIEKTIEICPHLKEIEAKLINRDEERNRIEKRYRGINVLLVKKTRQILDEAGYGDLEIIATSNIKLKQILDYVEAGADLVGIGEEAVAYLLNDCNLTSDICGGWKNGKFVPFAKEGREILRITAQENLNKERDLQIIPNGERVNLADYMPQKLV